jgi:hypothetical protein
MAKQTVLIGALPNDKTGDPLRTAFTKINQNFDEVYATAISTSELKSIVAASTDFADFKARIAAL